MIKWQANLIINDIRVARFNKKSQLYLYSKNQPLKKTPFIKFNLLSKRLLGWYRRFIDNYAALSCPLTELLKKRQSFIWNASAEDAFNKLKSFCKPQIFRTFYISLWCYHFWLGLRNMSEKLSKAQRNYSVTELECLAVIHKRNKKV